MIYYSSDSPSSLITESYPSPSHYFTHGALVG